MRIGMVDADREHRQKVTFPNLSLMKLSAWHKRAGDSVEWYMPLVSRHMDRVYISKVFSDSYTPDIPYEPDADEIIRGGSGYAITLEDGIERYSKDKDRDLPHEVDHIMPDYGLYGITDTAYGFMTKGCPRGCAFCHVNGIQGRVTYDFAELTEFWNGQRHIKLLDPNITASARWREHFQALADSKAYVDFTQGLDLRLMTGEKWDALARIRTKSVHFAWDDPKFPMEGRLKEAAEVLGRRLKELRAKYSVYILTNFNSTFEEDVYRVETVKGYGFQPYVMIYNKESAPKQIRRLQRYANNPFVCWKTNTFSDYRR